MIHFSFQKNNEKKLEIKNEKSEKLEYGNH